MQKQDNELGTLQFQGKMKKLRPDSLSGQKLKIDGSTINVIKKIGEGGSSYIYLVRSDLKNQEFSLSFSSSEDTFSTIDTDENSYTFDEEKGSSMKFRRGRESKDHQLVLKATLIANKKHRKQAENEINMLRKLSPHRNIVKFMVASEIVAPHSGQNCSINFLFMEYCRGGSLMDLIMKQKKIRERLVKQQSNFMISPKSAQNSPMASGKKFFMSNMKMGKRNISKKLDQLSGGFLLFEDILAIFEQICSAIAFLHDRYKVPSEQSIDSMTSHEKERYRIPIIHRDIKPENILLVYPSEHVQNPDMWRCKLCDFGSAVEGRVKLTSTEHRQRVRDQIQRTTTQMYRSPEMIDTHMADEITERYEIYFHHI